MPQGQKTCGGCGLGTGPRTLVCKGCGTAFGAKAASTFPANLPKPSVSKIPLDDVPDEVYSVAHDSVLLSRLRTAERTIEQLTAVVQQLAYQIDRLDDERLADKHGMKFVRGSRNGTYSNGVRNALRITEDADFIERDDAAHPTVIGEKLTFGENGKAKMVPVVEVGAPWDTDDDVFSP